MGKSILEQIALDFVKVWEEFNPPIITSAQKKYFIEGFVAGGSGLDERSITQKFDCSDKSCQHLFYCASLGWEMGTCRSSKAESKNLSASAIASGEEAILAESALEYWRQESQNFAHTGKPYFIKAFVLGSLGFDRRAADVKMPISKNGPRQEILKCVERGWRLGCKDFASRYARDIFEYIRLLERITILNNKIHKDCIFKGYMIALLGLDKLKTIAKLQIERDTNLVKCATIGWERGNQEFVKRQAKVKLLFESDKIDYFLIVEKTSVDDEIAKMKTALKNTIALVNTDDSGTKTYNKRRDIDSELEELRKQIEDM